MHVGAAATDLLYRLEQAATFSFRIGDLHGAIEFMKKLIEEDDMFENGFVENPDAARKTLTQLLAWRDGAGPAQVT